MREIKFRAILEGMETVTAPFDWYDLRMIPPVKVLMQYTGLKDKNGKEIYEGDILHSANEGHCQVHYDDFYGCWATQFKEAECEELLGNSLKDYQLEVIGNIYENPELLTI